MPLLTRSTNTSNYKLIPVGVHVARCVRIVDLGTQTSEYLGKDVVNRKVYISWETPFEKAIFKEENGEQPFMISCEYTNSLHEKANLLHMLEGWRGKQFSDEELKEFDLEKVLNQPCQIAIIHKNSKSGKTYPVITSVIPLSRGMACPDAINKPILFSISEWDETLFVLLPEWIQDKIKLSPEYRQTFSSDSESILQDKDEAIPF